MEAIGQILREAREQLGLTLDEVERATRIRRVRLEALESGDFDSLPSRVQAQGFLRNYADFLGLDPEPILEQYRREQEGQPGRGLRTARRLGAASRRPAGSQPRRFRIYGDQIITTVAALAVIAVLVWGTQRIFASLNQPEDVEALPAASPEALATLAPTSTAQLIGAENPPLQPATNPSPSVTPTLALGLVDSIEIEILAEQGAFVQVLVDGEQEFQGRMLPGEGLTFRGEERVELVTGNARGLRVLFNGQDQGILGEVNQVLTRVWTIRGMQTPTPTQTLTPTASPLVANTPTATITSVPLGGE